MLPQKKKRTHLTDSEDPAKKGQPKSFVFRRGRHGALLRDLEKDLRKVRPPLPVGCIPLVLWYLQYFVGSFYSQSRSACCCF